MSEPLTKSQLCWVIIRVAGVYLIFQAAFSLVVGLVTWLMTESTFSMSFAILPAETIGALVFAIGIGVVIPLFVGKYLLTNGITVHGWLMREPSERVGGGGGRAPRRLEGRKAPAPAVGRKAPAPKEEIDPKTKLTQAEATAFDAWLAKHPEYEGRELTDQIALFRDAQRKMKEGREGGGK